VQDRRATRVALKVSVTFWIAAVLWLLFSDILLAAVGVEFDGWTDVAKGVLFMTVVALVIYAYLHRRVERETQLLEQIAHQAELEAELFQSSPEAMWVYDPTTLEILEVNETMVDVYGRSRHELLSLTVPDLSPPTDRSTVERVVRDLQDRGDPHTWLIVDSSGLNRWVEVTSNAITLDGRPVRLAVGRDVTAQRSVEDALRASERRLAGVLTSMREMAFTVDVAADRIEWLNDVAAELLGAPLDELIMTVADFVELVVPDDRQSVLSTLDEVVSRGWAETEVRFVAPTGTERILGLRGRAVTDEDGRVTQIDGVAIDLTRRNELEDLVAHQRSFDQLTGLPVRTAFLASIDASLAITAPLVPRPVVAMFDLDRFADVNESAGHTAGDKLLVAVAQRMSAVLEPGMVAARVGGDEFALFCPGGMASSSDIGTRLRNAVEGPFLVGSYEFFVSMSVGLAEAQPGDDAEDLIRDAHLAMSAAKARTTGIELFEPLHRSLAMDRVRIDTELRRAIAEGQLVAVYQPEVDLRTRRVVAVEALVRWRHPTRGLVSAAEFVGEAERSNLVADLGDIMLEHSFGQAARWRARYGEDAPVVWVNLSRRELDDPAVVDRVLVALDRAGVPLEAVGLEITETAFVAEGGEAVRSLGRLADAGLALALDDFGTGWSSLQSLRSFPLTTVKIDQSFVQNVATEVRDRQLVAAVIGMAKGLSLQTLAEGVETAAQLQVLTELGCDIAQGYLLGRPGSAVAIEGVLDLGGVPEALTRAGSRSGVAVGPQ
jgi:diguanylate cyclase (GGDEF)-like protein/PAS domain S-box-containing protein